MEKYIAINLRKGRGWWIHKVKYVWGCPLILLWKYIIIYLFILIICFKVILTKVFLTKQINLNFRINKTFMPPVTEHLIEISTSCNELQTERNNNIYLSNSLFFYGGWTTTTFYSAFITLILNRQPVMRKIKTSTYQYSPLN